MLKINLRIVHTFICACLVAVFAMGCSGTTDDGDNNNQTKDDYFNVSLNLYDAVLAVSPASRSILPEVTSNALYFTVVATNNAGAWSGSSQLADGTPTDIVYYRCTTAGVPSSDITLNLKASEYWRITVYGTATVGPEVDADATLDTKKELIDSTSDSLPSTAIVTGNICFYLGSNGTTYDIDSILNTTTPSGTEKTSLKVTTAPASTGKGSINLPIQTTAASGITYIKATFSGRTVNSVTPSHDQIAKTFTAADTKTTIEATDFTPGLYDVDIILATGSSVVKESYAWHETLTIWSNNTSTWANTVAGNYAGSGTTADPYYLDVTDEKIAAYRRTTFYVGPTTAGGTGHIPAGDDASGTGSIFKPYATVEKAVEQCSADGTSWQIIVDGTSTNTAFEAKSGSSYGGIYVTSSSPATAATTDDLIITVRRFAASSANVTNADSLNADKPVLYVAGANTTFTLQNITVTGLVTVATDKFVMDAATITKAVSLKTAGNCITVDLDDTTSSVGSIYPAFVSYNALIIKANDDKLTNAWFTSMPTKFPLNSTYAATNALAVLALDQKSGATTEGDIILKRKAAIGIDASSSAGYTVTMSAAATTWTKASSDTGTDIKDVVTIEVKDSSNVTQTTGISEVKGIIYDNSGTSYALTADSDTSFGPTFTIPGIIKGEVGTYTMEVSFAFNKEIFAGNIALSVTN